MKAIINGSILLPDRAVDGCALLYTDRIEGIVPASDIPADATRIDAAGGYLLPGLIDLHIHGWGGVDVTTAQPDALLALARALAGTGVTGFLPTTVTADLATLQRSWAACRAAMAHPENRSILGVNAEGPFISPAKCGAQNPADAIPAQPQAVVPYADVVRLVTVAPERPGAEQAIRALTRAGIRVAIGHTEADYDTALGAIRAGACHITHLFNAMPALAHRAPGTVGAALDQPVFCELIADNHHIHPALYEPLWRIKGERLCLVTDALAAGGCATGEATLFRARITSDGQVCRLADGTLAGSITPLMQCVKNAYEAGSIPLWEWVHCASLHPATLLGIQQRKGSLAPGKDADIVLTDRALQVRATIQGGTTVYRAE